MPSPSTTKRCFSTPETDLDIAKRSLDAIDTEACHQALKTFWEAPGYHLILTTKEKPANAEQDLAALFEDSRGTPVEAPSARAIQVFDYTDFGKPGTVASRKEVADLRITRACCPTKSGSISSAPISSKAKSACWRASVPASSPNPKTCRCSIISPPRCSKAAVSASTRMTTCNRSSPAKTSARHWKSSEDAFTLAGTTTPADFALQCQLMCASITDPGYREEALWQFQKAIPMIYQQLNHTPAGPQREMDGWLHGGDSRYSIAPVRKLSSYTLDDVKKWLTPELTKGYLELTIVGDFEPEKILPELLATFGALPAREAAAPVMADARKVKFPNAPAAKTFTYQSKIQQAVAFTIWKTAGVRGNQKEFRRLNLLAEILGDRLREEIREKLGASYSPNAGASGSDALEGMGYLLSESIGKPDDLDLLLNTMRDLADQLATHGATADELDRALKPTLGQLEKSLRDNNYWLTTVMSQCQADPKRLDLARTRDADYRSITLKEINALAKKYLAAQNALLVSIKPAL